MNPDESGQTRITANVVLDNEPAWAPDGTSIVLTSDEGDAGGLGEIVRIAADGSGRTNLTQTPAIDELGPDWQPAANVPAYDFAGFFAPVNNQPTLNKMNAGRARPVKFSLAGDHGLDIFAPGTRARRGSTATPWPTSTSSRRPSPQGRAASATTPRPTGTTTSGRRTGPGRAHAAAWWSDSPTARSTGPTSSSRTHLAGPRPRPGPAG